MAPDPSTTSRRSPTGLRQFLDPDQQRDWIEGDTELADADERSESLELRFKYLPRFQKLLRRPQAREVLEILALYGRNCIPIPRRSERQPSTSDKPLIRVNASWMELFTLYPDGEGIRARFLVHLSDFTTDHSAVQDRLDAVCLQRSVATPDDIGYFFTRSADMVGINVRGAASIRRFIAERRVLRAIRTFNLTHMNRGRNAYQASHCYSLADYMLAD